MIIDTRFDINDVLFYVKRTEHSEIIPCEDCLGEVNLELINKNNKKINVICKKCFGSGEKSETKNIFIVEQVVVKGIYFDHPNPNLAIRSMLLYRCSSGKNVYHINDNDLFIYKADAIMEADKRNL